ncbi:MAG: hypothetical protein FJ344_02835 [Sphingomonadales bacterium]|nr:hypothetical protein [Sphingomonadales bacterium]
MLRISLLFVILSAALLACTGGGEKLSMETGKVVLLASGPLYEGSNTATVEWIPAPEAVSGKKITSARVSKIRLMGSGEYADLFSDITFSLAAPGADMRRVGVLNPVAVGDSIWELQVADEQKNIEDFFKGKPITLVADVNLKRDLEADLNLTAEVVFETENKK